MMKPPSFDTSPLTPELSQKVIDSFHNGIAEKYPARSLVRSGLVTYHPLRGGIYWRREPVKYIIVHSTETGIPLTAIRVIESWSSMGRRHPGAQYVVERDGTIYQAVDPDLATVHVNIFKTRAGINNDNSIGIEMCHTGKQVYTKEQTESTIKLVSYLQDRYGVSDEFVTTHRWAQQGDHTDPVGFDWNGFLQSKYNFRRQAIANKLKKIEEDAQLCWSTGLPQAPVYMQPHKKLKKIEDSLPQTQQNQQKPQNQQIAPEEKQKPKENLKESPKENPAEDKSPLIVPVSVQPPKEEVRGMKIQVSEKPETKNSQPQESLNKPVNLKGPIEMSPELLKQLK
jgi:hypothetical protein